MVVYDKIDPYKHLYDVDDENTVITLADWFHLQSRELALNGAGASANSSLINGKGRYPDGPAVPLAVISVQKNKRYRFRLVSLSCDANFNFTIDGHKLTVIEADGQLVKPLVVDSIRIFAGQRYSFVLHANQSVSNYWIRAQPSTGFGRLPDTTEGGLNSAILRYAGAPDEDPKSIEVPSKLPLREPNLHPLLNPAPPGSPTFEMTLAIGFNGTEWSMNNVTWDAPVKNPIHPLADLDRSGECVGLAAQGFHLRHTSWSYRRADRRSKPYRGSAPLPSARTCVQRREERREHRI